MPNGSKYDYWLTEEGLNLIKGWRRKGMSQRDIAETIHVNVSRFAHWCKKFPEFAEAIHTSPDLAINEVENALLLNAKGQWITEETREEWAVNDVVVRTHVTKHQRYIAPLLGAQCFFLKNRDAEHWKDNPTENMSNADDKVEIVIDV